jgi:hypothetical protein
VLCCAVLCCDVQSTVFGASVCGVVQRNCGLFRLDHVFFTSERVRFCSRVVRPRSVLQGSRARITGGARRGREGRKGERRKSEGREGRK